VQVASDSSYPAIYATDIILAPGGVQIAASLQDNQVQILKPYDNVIALHTIPTIFDVVPAKGARAQGAGGHTFTIGGANLNFMGARRVHATAQQC
jgi:hypothetical protein